MKSYNPFILLTGLYRLSYSYSLRYNNLSNGKFKKSQCSLSVRNIYLYGSSAAYVLLVIDTTAHRPRNWEWKFQSDPYSLSFVNHQWRNYYVRRRDGCLGDLLQVQCTQDLNCTVWRFRMFRTIRLLMLLHKFSNS